jgi:PPP family 3-phenylpropionic acid transporter
LPLYWRSLGFSPPDLGLLTAIAPAIAAVAPFLWTAYADATRRGERILLANTWIAAMAALLFPNVASFWSAAGAVLIYAAFRTSLIPLANSMTFRALRGRRQGYAAIRLWGTLGYIVVAVGAGFLVDRIGLRMGIYGMALAMMACGVVGWVGRSRERTGLPPVRLQDFRRTLRDRRVLLLLLATCLAQVSFGPYTTFFTIHLQQLGLSRGFAGTAWALAAGSELVVMLVWTRLCALASTRTWLTAALAAHAIRWGLFVVARDPAFLLAIQLTHAFTFGVFYLASVQTMDALVPEGLRATAQGVFASVSFGLGGLVGNTLAGLLYEPLGMARSYLVAAALATGATGVYWAGTRRAGPDGRAAAVRAAGGVSP